ncbi:MAG: sialate O-acetylesterase, partial [Verrucomicrobiales bacterium]
MSSRKHILAAAATLLASTLASPAATDPGPLQVYILAGQSNMVGQGEMSPETSPGTLEYTVANNPEGAYGFVSDGTGGWASWDDVWVHYEKSSTDLRTGDLTTGYGNATEEIGPELGFGYTMSSHHSNQVLIIKAAWGGKSLAVDFRPPSSSGDTGFYYSEILRVVNDALDNLGTYFPEYDASAGYEIAGFAWHQGWNDRVITSYVAEYEENMANFIRDIRADLGSPCPFVIATTGMEGWDESKTSALALMQAQLNIADPALYPEFDGNVHTVDTRDFWRDGSVSPVASGQEYHWNRNALTYLDIGIAMANAMTTLDDARCPSALRATGGADGVTLSWSNGTDIPTSVRVLRNGREIAASIPGTPPSYLDTTAGPRTYYYQLEFTMSGDPCDPISTTIDTCLSDLAAVATDDGVVLTWENQLTYQGIEITRDGSVIAASLNGSLETYTDTAPPVSGIVTYTAVSTNGDCTPASATVNLNTRTITGPVLFADTFDRDNSTDLNASTDGKSGTLGALNYTGRTINNVTLDINNNALRINGPAGDGAYGGLVYINDHNFIDSTIEAGGGFAVTVGIAAYSTAGSGRRMSIGVGQSLADLDAQSGADPASHAADLVVGYRATTDALEIHKNGVLDETESVSGGLPDAPTTMRIEYLLSSFDAGSPVNYAVFFDDDEVAFASGSFTWSGTDENYISLASNLSNDSRFDNLEISGGMLADDNAAPTPSPMTWESPPAALSSSEITMTATTASDSSGVEYYFTNTTDNSHDSGWQDSPAFTDTGLAAETTYSYTVTARDKSAAQNTSAASATASATTPQASSSVAAPIAGVDFGNDADTAFDRTPDDLNTADGISVSADWSYAGNALDVKSDNSANASGSTTGSFVAKLNGGTRDVAAMPELTPTTDDFSWSITIPAGVTLNLSAITFDIRQGTATAGNTRWAMFNTSLDGGPGS